MKDNTPSAWAVRNIGELFIGRRGPAAGREMGEAPVVRDAVVLVRDGIIEAMGAAGDVSIPDEYEVIDAQGGCVVPGLIDCHTHTVYAGSREGEFVQRCEGRSYAEIAESGGGIKTTVESVRNASLEDLVESALPRLRRMLEAGTTTAEIKSGYGLTPDDEIKMLQAVHRLAQRQPVELIGTYLAAHTVPGEFAGRPNEYLDLVLDPAVLRRITDNGLAKFADVFCERTAFDVDASRRFLTVCKEHGLTPRLHADQITQCGASRLAAELGAASADHLEHIDDDGIAAMRSAGTVAVLLPGCSFFLGVEQAPARRLIDGGLAVALATDLNPGSSLIESMPLVMSIACTQMHMTPTEALIASTANAAAAIRRSDRLGALLPGMQADLLILDVPNHLQWAYHVGRNCVRTVIKSGNIVHPG